MDYLCGEQLRGEAAPYKTPIIHVLVRFEVGCWWWEGNEAGY